MFHQMHLELFRQMQTLLFDYLFQLRFHQTVLAHMVWAGRAGGGAGGEQKRVGGRPEDEEGHVHAVHQAKLKVHRVQ